LRDGKNAIARDTKKKKKKAQKALAHPHRRLGERKKATEKLVGDKVLKDGGVQPRNWQDVWELKKLLDEGPNVNLN